MSLLFVKRVLIVLLLIVAPVVLSAEEPVKFKIESEISSIKPESSFWVALELEIEDHWHAYWKNPGDAGMPPQINWTLPDGFAVEAIEWPSPERFTMGDAEAYGYSGKTILLARLLPPADLKLNSDLTLGVDLRWVVCNEETCLPGASSGELKLPVKEGLPAKNSETAALFEKARTFLPQKTKHIKTERNESNVKSLVEAIGLSADSLETAYFCPEENGASNEIALAEGAPGQIVLTYKEKPGQEASPLKGVIVAGGQGYEVNVPVSQASPLSDQLNSYFLALMFAFIGGMILNLMPCVLPVVSLKVLSFVNLAKESRRAVIKHGALFTLGVMISFWALAACLLALQAYGHAVGWGFQLQEPFFVAVLAGLMLLFALSLFGVFELGTKAASWAGDKQVNHREGPWAPFFSGVLATAVATPCTGPFLGSAVGYAFTLSSFKALMIFTSLGFGMAFPYLLLSFFPAWLKFVPRPGAWMETFKQLMGFMMLLTVLWLTWVFSGQTSSFAVIVLLAAYFVIGVAAWIWGQWGTPASSGRVRKISFALALILIVFSGKMAYTASALASTETEIIAANDWEPFSPERVQELRAKGVPVFIDFTAKWCLICQTNHLALSSQKVMDKMNAKGVVKMKADWTKNDPVITAELKKWGRSGVPLYLYYEKDDTPAVLPQVLTPDLIVDALD